MIPLRGRYYIVRNNLAMDFEFNHLVPTPLQNHYISIMS